MSPGSLQDSARRRWRASKDTWELVAREARGKPREYISLQLSEGKYIKKKEWSIVSNTADKASKIIGYNDMEGIDDLDKNSFNGLWGQMPDWGRLQ